MSLKKVFLLTSEYPFGASETFVDDEVKFSEKKVDLTIIPVHGHTADKSFPDRKTVSRVDACFCKKISRKEKIRWIAIALNSCHFKTEILSLIRYRKLKFSTFFAALRICARGERIAFFLSQKYSEEFNDENCQTADYPRRFLQII